MNRMITHREPTSKDTAITIKIAFNCGWMTKRAAVQALCAIGHTSDEAVYYLLTPIAEASRERQP